MISEQLYQSTGAVAANLARLLQQQNHRIVFAESCTAGLASATMAGISGISNWLCGCAVTYRVPVKQAWLNIDPNLIESFSAVSSQVTRAMTSAVLARTDDATISVGITGHLEPDELDDGPLVFVGIGYRKSGLVVCRDPERFLLKETSRPGRQWEATRVALEVAVRFLKETEST